METDKTHVKKVWRGISTVGKIDYKVNIQPPNEDSDTFYNFETCYHDRRHEPLIQTIELSDIENKYKNMKSNNIIFFVFHSKLSSWCISSRLILTLFYLF